MNKQAFLNLLKNPDTISVKDLEGLEEVISNFPFFQVAHILAAKGANDQGKMLSELKIRKAAGYSAERKTLKKFIKSKPVAALSVKEESKNKNSTGNLNEPKSTAVVVPVITSPIVEISTSNNNSFEEEKLSLNKNLGIKAEEKKEKIKARISEVNLDNAIQPKEEVKSALVDTSSSDNFFTQLEENLSQLKLTKTKANQDLGKSEQITILDQINDKPATLDSKMEPLPVEAKDVIGKIEVNQPVSIKQQEIITPKNSPSPLLKDSVKEHSEETNIFSSRLDEVIEDKSTNVKPSINEADLLLNYLAFLNSHKSTVIKDKKKTEDIIEQFIKKDPSIPYMNNIKLPEENEDKASQSYQLKGAFVSENMAKIYIKQEKFDKAIEIYQQLMLKNPEKKPYFVTQIEKLKSNS